MNSSDTSFGNSNNVKVLKPSSPFGATSAFNNPFTFNNNGNPPAFASAFAPTFKDLMSGQGGQQSELSQNKRVGDDDIETNELKIKNLTVNRINHPKHDAHNLKYINIYIIPCNL